MRIVRARSRSRVRRTIVRNVELLSYVAISCYSAIRRSHVVMGAYCRFCVQKISSKHSVSLFKSENFQQALGWKSCSPLLDMLVEANDGFSQVICERCKRRLVRLEKASEELSDFRKLAHDSYQSFLPRSSLKRTKKTSAMVGISPDTQKLDHHQVAHCFLSMQAS